MCDFDEIVCEFGNFEELRSQAVRFFFGVSFSENFLVEVFEVGWRDIRRMASAVKWYVW